MIDCTLYHDSTSVDCNGFTVYDIPNCDPYCWKTIWLACSIITSTVWLLLLNTKMLPKLRPLRNKKIFMSIIKKPYFWSLNTITGTVVLYDVLIMVSNSNAKIYVECLVVVSKLWTLLLLFQLNFTFPPSRKKGFRVISRGAYCLTMSVFVLDNLCKFLTVSSQVAFKLYTVEYGETKPMTIVDLMLMIINASLYLNFLQFFWQKLFRGDKDILTIFKQEVGLTEDMRRVLRRRKSIWQRLARRNLISTFEKDFLSTWKLTELIPDSYQILIKVIVSPQYFLSLVVLFFYLLIAFVVNLIS